MADWTKIGLVSKEQFDAQMLVQNEKLDEIKDLIIQSNQMNQQNIENVLKGLKKKLNAIEKKVSQELNENLTHTQKKLQEQMCDLKENMGLIEETLKLNWANQLLSQLENNLQAYEIQKNK